MDPYATHLEALVETALRTPGDILELGCGDYSTPVLAVIAKAQGKRFLVHAQDPAWASRYRQLAEVVLVLWERWTPPTGPWGVVLLDSEQSTAQRIRHLPALAKVASTVVLHDADISMRHPHWKECAKDYDEPKLYDRLRPWTAVLRPC